MFRKHLAVVPSKLAIHLRTDNEQDLSIAMQESVNHPSPCSNSSPGVTCLVRLVCDSLGAMLEALRLEIQEAGRLRDCGTTA